MYSVIMINMQNFCIGFINIFLGPEHLPFSKFLFNKFTGSFLYPDILLPDKIFIFPAIIIFVQRQCNVHPVFCFLLFSVIFSLFWITLLSDLSALDLAIPSLICGNQYQNFSSHFSINNHYFPIINNINLKAFLMTMEIFDSIISV